MKMAERYFQRTYSLRFTNQEATLNKGSRQEAVQEILGPNNKEKDEIMRYSSIIVKDHRFVFANVNLYCLFKRC